jgi:probable rRNA maturation factor
VPVAVEALVEATPELVSTVAERVSAAMRGMGVSGSHEVTVVLADDAELDRLNRTYRGQDGPTDVLSFPFDPRDTPEGEAPYLGDIVISLERAAAQAGARGDEPTYEVCLLAVHGLLHLLGQEDDTDAQALAMQALEIELGARRPDDT